MEKLGQNPIYKHRDIIETFRACVWADAVRKKISKTRQTENKDVEDFFDE